MDEVFRKEFLKRVSKYSNEEIKEILKKRKHYNTDAASIAINEAIKRNIINNESDLLAEEYRDTSIKFSIFPPIPKLQSRTRIIKSLSRSILLIGLIPLIYGLFKSYEQKSLEAIVLLLLGGIWILTSSLLLLRKEVRFANVILLIAALSVIYIVSFFMQMKTIRVMDIFVAFILYSLVFYSIFYIKSLLKIKE